jgi:hypothetical protein
MSLRETQTALINKLLSTLNEADPDGRAAAILIGSVARKAATAKSDLDLLVVAEKPISVKRGNDRIHLQVMSEPQFMERLKAGDDFAAWCVRFGIPVRQAAVWNRIVQSAEAEVWPEWRNKIDHAARRLLLADQLMKLNDDEAAAEELSYAVSHVARGLLLKEGEFPLSRAEMISQLRDAGYPHLSDILQDFTFGRQTAKTIRQALLYVKKLLVHMDKERFHKYVEERRVVRKQKALRGASGDKTYPKSNANRDR